MGTEPTGMFVASERSTLRRRRDRGSNERAVIDAILDEGLICHVGFTDGGSVFVVPMAYARVGNSIYLHGAAANHALRSLANAEVCVTVTLLDGLVFARSAFHHSMNYRSVMLFGTGLRVEDLEEKNSALLAIIDHMALGRSQHARPPTPGELRATLVMRVPIEDGSAKVRAGGPTEEAEDLGLSIWAGELPLLTVTNSPIPDGGIPDEVSVPEYVAEYPSRRHVVDLTQIQNDRSTTPDATSSG